MAICRWSTPVSGGVTFDELYRLIIHGVPNHLMIINKLNRKRKTEYSRWYIYEEVDGIVINYRLNQYQTISEEDLQRIVKLGRFDEIVGYAGESEIQQTFLRNTLNKVY